MSDDKLQDAIHRGHRATELVNDPLLNELLDRYERNCIEQWKATELTDTAAREGIWSAVVAAGKVREGLKFLAADGRVAQRDLERAIELRSRRGEFND